MGIFTKETKEEFYDAPYLHQADRATLKALKAIPGFSALLKAFMKIWSEKTILIQNMSSNLRVSEKQLSKYYEMLLPICEKLDIKVPQMYVTLDVAPNAYTIGDENPCVVLTSGLIENFPDELIKTVIAHECGHIACHHSLYTTMGRIILEGGIEFLGLSQMITLPLQIAFSYWMRCSEFSADRAAAFCDDSAENIIDMCMRFSGYDRDFGIPANKEAFLEQAYEYRKLVEGSAWNKTLEFLILKDMDHPFNAIRALEAKEWVESDFYKKLTTGEEIE
jgi:Zn-dependent protease with chaperone function